MKVTAVNRNQTVFKNLRALNFWILQACVCFWHLFVAYLPPPGWATLSILGLQTSTVQHQLGWVGSSNTMVNSGLVRASIGGQRPTTRLVLQHQFCRHSFPFTVRLSLQSLQFRFWNTHFHLRRVICSNSALVEDVCYFWSCVPICLVFFVWRTCGTICFKQYDEPKIVVCGLVFPGRMSELTIYLNAIVVGAWCCAVTLLYRYLLHWSCATLGIFECHCGRFLHYIIRDCKFTSWKSYHVSPKKISSKNGEIHKEKRLNPNWVRRSDPS